MSRREQILETAAELFAAKGFHGVSVGEIGRACGISGPALYKHFASKDAVLAAMLVDISQRLLDEGRARRRPAAGDAQDAIDAADRLAHRLRAAAPLADRRPGPRLAVAAAARRASRCAPCSGSTSTSGPRQLRRLHRGLHTDRARAMAHAAFGLINSTPHSGLIPDEAMRGVLHRMALGALTGPQTR